MEDTCCVRTCSNCGSETESEYTDGEWDDRDNLCEMCEQENDEEELITLDII